MEDVFLANDKYRATLRSTYVHGVDTTFEVTAIPTNLPTIITLGWETDFECQFSVEGVSGDSASNYTLTGITRLKGYEGNLAEGTTVNCLNNEEYFNQYGDLIAGAIEDAEDAIEATEDIPGLKEGSILFVIDGGGATITTGIKGDLRIPFACTINRATLLADQSGSIVVDIWKDTLANFPPTDADSITASAPPTITTDTDSEDSTLTGWTTSITADDILRFNVDSVTSCQRVTVELQYTRT